MSTLPVADGPVTVDPAEAAERRARALEVSGWGQRFSFVQPHNLCFWVYVALTALGAVQLWSYFSPNVAFLAPAYAIAAVLCGVCGGVWALWFHHIDRWERQPVGLVLAGLVWGGVAATFAFALPANTAMLSLYAKLFGQDWASSWAAGFTAPINEEAAKLCGLVLLLGLAPRLLRTANDGLVMGAFIGLGFATVENFLYAANGSLNAFGTNPVGNAVQISMTRIAVSFVSHPLFSALVCSGAIYVLGTAAQPRRIGRGLAFVVAGVVLHFSWDDAGGLGFGSGLLMFVVMGLSIIVGLTILGIAFRLAVPEEHQIVRDILAPEVAAGTVTAEEVESVVDRKARRAYVKAGPSHHARRGRKHLRRAILDLTHDLAAAQGADTDPVRHARGEVARIRAVAEPATP